MTHSDQHTNEHYQTILDSITDGVFTVDLNFRITFFNWAAEQITGVSRENAMGQPCEDILKANVCDQGCIVKQAIQTGKPVVNIPIHIKRADGKRIPISASATLLKNRKGKVTGGVETFRDLYAVHKLRRALLKQHTYEDIVSKNPKMREIFSILPRIAESQSTVLIHGASGTGKELVARAIHNHSHRRKGPFIPINCGALPETLCESELFGYKAGAFTDAKNDKPGRFALAQDGTIFLDEIGDISPAVQVRLLRVLEDKLYEPLGATQPVKTNARVIAATHSDLVELVRQGCFREDLYFRIDIIKLSLPPLSSRKEDIPLLVEHFVEHFNHLSGRKVLGFTQEAMAALMMYAWPGNVRELENAVEHAFVLCPGELIRLQYLPERIIPSNGVFQVPTGLTLKEIERHAIEKALQRNKGRKLATARELGIDKKTLRRKIKRWDINR